jgi:protein-S-isoprenylcysteine O-methyltransferase Ste14
MPPTYFLIYALLGLGLHFAVPLAKFIPFPYRLIGIALLGFGGWINVWTDNLFKKRNTTVKPYEKPSSLIADGPFRISRHPMYLGMAAALLGEAIILGSLIAFLAPVAFVVTMELLFIRHEEKAMQGTFGDQYSRYKRRVRRWL